MNESLLLPEYCSNVGSDHDLPYIFSPAYTAARKGRER